MSRARKPPLNQNRPTSRTSAQSHRLWCAGYLCATVVLSFVVICFVGSTDSVADELILPQPDTQSGILIASKTGHRFRQGQYDVWVLQGDCHLQQGPRLATCNEAVIWVLRSTGSNPSKVIAYLEGGVTVNDQTVAEERPSFAIKNETWIGRFYTLGGIEVRVPKLEPVRSEKPEVYYRAKLLRDKPLTASPAQFPQQNDTPQDVIEPLPDQSLQDIPRLENPPAQNFQQNGPVIPSVGTSARRIRMFSRGSMPIQAEWRPRPETDEWLAIIDSGVNVLIEDATIEDFGNLGTIDISTDRLVVWTKSRQRPEAEVQQQGQTPLEFYMEGNIVFRQGQRVIYADRMYYDVRNETGVILDAEVLTPLPNFEGLVRLKADVLRQLDRQNFEGLDASVTSSRMGIPRYWVQSRNIAFQDNPKPKTDRFGRVLFDQDTGQPLQDRQMLATGRNNYVYAGGWPIFYWPFLSTDLTQPSYYLRSLSVNNDSIFGTQVLTDWNIFQLLGFEQPPEGTDWVGTIDYLSDRGIGFGTNFQYDVDQFLGHTGRTRGFLDAWFINDSGKDVLGRDRRSVPLEEEFRGRVFGRHRQYLPLGYQLTAEVGWLSDRNFLEQYYEQDWDREKDLTTGIEFKRLIENRSWSIAADFQLNDFFTQTEWLPRLDHYWLGQPIAGSRLLWTEHSSIGFARFNAAEAPTNPVDITKFDPLAWEQADAEGVRAATKHELSLPFTLGGLNVVPYALGEAAYWQNDLNGDDVARTLGQTGIRASLPMWRVDPTIKSELLNMNGMAHKVVFDVDVFFAEANEDFDNLPLYDSLDDDSIEAFRRRFLFDTFAGTFGDDVPLRFDERNFALRSGVQRWVSSPTTEIADDMFAVRAGINQRWQTKRGFPGQQRIVDFVTLDVEGTFFPKAARDNFGENFGQLSYDLRWFLGDRFSILSDGYADTFQDGLKTASIGAQINRPGRGRYYTGFRTIDGPFTSHVVSAAISYRLSQKWIINYGSSYDFGNTGNIGQRAQIVRVGESFLVGIGFNYDHSRNNLGIRFSIVPRFVSSKMGRVAGQPIPPVGAFGLE